MTIGERIKELRQELGLTAEEVAKKLNKNRATVYRYENNDIENLPVSVLEPLSKVLRTTPEYIMGWTDNRDGIPGIFPIELKKFPLLGEISCGVPTYAEEDRESYVLAGRDIRADFCLIAKGDSMINARIKEGDIVFIRAQPDVENGEIAAVLIEDETTLKRVHKKSNSVVLMAENPAYEPLVYTNEELNSIRILGKAVAFQSDV